MHATPEGVRIAPLEYVYRYGEESAENEEIQKGRVADLAGEVAARTDGAPDEAGVEVGAGEGAGEAVDGVGGADVFDVAESPGEHAGGAEGSGDHSNALHEEETSRGDLSWMVELVRGRVGDVRG